MDLLDRIDGWGHECASRGAHVSGARQITYGELLGRSNTLAACLARILPEDRSPVVVLGHKEPEMLVAFLGAVKSGHPYVPVDDSLPPERVARIVSLSGARLTLTPDRVAELTTEGRPSPAGRRVRGSDPYYIIFTSGSTGEPKGVVITLDCLTDFVTWMLGEHAIAPGEETFLNQAPFSFDLSVMDLYLSLATGGTLFSLTRDEIANLKELYRALAASGTTTWVSTPSFAQMCLVERGFDAGMCPRIRRFLFCGETLAPAVATQLLDRFPAAEVWNTYGPTEATVATTSIRVDRELLSRHAPLPVGYPKPRTRIDLLTETGVPAGPGERGEIVISGPNVALGYLGQPDLTDAAFSTIDRQRAYRTGDWGRFQDGLLFFEGRIDNQIKLHGYRVELGDIEANLCALASVRDAVVLPVTKRGRIDSLVAFVILKDRGADPDDEIANALRASLAERLPNYMLPRRFRFLPAFPMNANGKADRRKLAETVE